MSGPGQGSWLVIGLALSDASRSGSRVSGGEWGKVAAMRKMNC
jgi:hypothetical protein